MNCRLFNGLLVLLLTACSPFQQYRQADLSCQAMATDLSPCATASRLQLQTASQHSYHLSFIEFDDQGQLWDRQQLHQVLDGLYAQAARQDLLLLVFVHGWKHSAQAGDDNIDTFNRILARITDDEVRIAAEQHRPARGVAGIYLGWRGGSIPLPLVEQLTFWERKNTAQQVGTGGVAEVLSRLEALRLTKNAQAESPFGTRLAVIGHSFGGAILFSSLAQILENRFVDTQGPAGQNSNVRGFADLVVLVNPAFEAARFSTLSDMAAERGHYFQSQLPVLAILTSTADHATRVAFKAGRLISTLFERTQSHRRFNAVLGRTQLIDQQQAKITAIGHFAPYRTHQLAQASHPAPAPEIRQQLQQLQQGWRQDRPGSRLSIAGLSLERSLDSAGRNPYLVIQVSPELIAGHNDLGNTHVLDFVRQLILLSMNSPKPEPNPPPQQ